MRSAAGGSGTSATVGDFVRVQQVLRDRGYESDAMFGWRASGVGRLDTPIPWPRSPPSNDGLRPRRRSATTRWEDSCV